jgi:hypothetical protein
MLADLGLDRYGVTTGSQRKYRYFQSLEDRLGLSLIVVLPVNQPFTKIFFSPISDNCHYTLLSYQGVILQCT